jgi:hypothetical protein
VAGDVEGPVSWTVEPPRPGHGGEPGRSGHAGGGPEGDGLGAGGRVEGGDLRRLVEAEGLVARNPDAAFVDAVADRRPAYPAIAEALPAHVLADAAYRSAAGRGASIPL